MRGSVVKIETVPAVTGAVLPRPSQCRSACAIRDKPAGVVTDLAQPMMKINRRERSRPPADQTQLPSSAPNGHLR
jgi:hypothetical protein